MDNFCGLIRKFGLINLACFMVLVTCGFSAYAQQPFFEIPTRTGDGKRIHTLIGFSTALANNLAAFNQVVRYNPREDSVDASAAFVVKVGRQFFPVIEILGEDAHG